MKTFALSKPEKINPAFLITFRTTSKSTEYNQLDNIATKIVKLHVIKNLKVNQNFPGFNIHLNLSLHMSPK